MQNDRRSKIAEIISTKGSVKISELTTMFAKSEMTIHRDLTHLEKQGILQKSRGGAVANPSSRNINYAFRCNHCLREKQLIAKAACNMIENGDTIVIDGSTTAIEVAKQLKNTEKHISVFTNSPLILYELVNLTHLVLYSIGTFFSHEMVHFIGGDVEERIRDLTFSKGFFGASAIMDNMTLADPYPQLASIKERVIKSSVISIALADHTKFGRVAVQKFAQVKDVDCIITDDKLDKKYIESISKVSNLIIAGSKA